MDDFKVFYDEEEDILYLAKEGEEAEVVEISPGVNMELDSNGKLIGVELFNASRMLMMRVPHLKWKIMQDPSFTKRGQGRFYRHLRP